MANAEGMIILGIDPGTRAAGLGVVRRQGPNSEWVFSRTVRMSGKLELADRLRIFHEAIAEVLAQYQPDAVAVEAVFQHKFARSALILGHARGVALLACAQAGIEVAEYPPARVKSAITGKGNASKAQVKRMVELLLRRRMDGVSDDESDALALALCHAQGAKLMALAAAASRGRR